MKCLNTYNNTYCYTRNTYLATPRETWCSIHKLSLAGRGWKISANIVRTPTFFSLVFFPFCFNVLNFFQNSYFKAYLTFRFLLGLILSHSYRLLGIKREWSFSLVVINYANIFGNFGQEINRTLRSAWKFSGQSCPPPEVVLFDWSVQTDRNLPLLFQNSRFQSYFAKQSVITILVETQKDRLVAIENFVSMEQFLSIFWW